MTVDTKQGGKYLPTQRAVADMLDSGVDMAKKSIFLISNTHAWLFVSYNKRNNSPPWRP